MCPHAQIQREIVLSGKRIRCVLVHDHVLLRQGLRRLLLDEPDLDVVAEAGNAADAIRRVFEFRPEVVIADAGIFGCTADQAARILLHESPQSKVLFLAGGEAGVPAATRDEASCTERQTSAEELVEMVRAQGSAEAQTSIRKRNGWAVGELAQRKRLLTDREREVLKLLAEGRTVRSAASFLGLSAKTVDAHKFNLMRKLGIHNKAELVMWAIQKKVVKLPANY